MSWKSTLISCFLLFAMPWSAVFAQDDSVDQRIILIGDAGELINNKASVIDAVRKLVPLEWNTTVLYLGDNLYSAGLPDEQFSNYNDKRKVLDSEVALVRGTPVRAFFMAGNHDWANGQPQGFESLIRQQIYLEQISPDNVKFLPENGCPGPEEVHISEDITVVIMDSQWWLNRRDRPGIESDCDTKTEEEVLAQLKDILERNSKKLVIFACHHPFRSVGFHSGYYGIRQHIFPFTDLNRYAYIPLPLIGSIYPISRGVFGSPQDIGFPSYYNMANQVDQVLKTHPYVIRVAGHEHTLQYIKDSSNNYIVSGAGCKLSRIAHPKKVKYAARSMGFAVLEIMKSKDVRLKFYKVPITTTPKLDFSDTILNFSKFPDLAEDTVTPHDLPTGDSVTVAVNADYDKVPWITRKIVGENYRKEWAMPVKFRVFYVNKEKGGFTILKLSGGKQSKSLHLMDRDGKRWVLRTLNKSIDKLVPPNFQESFAHDLVKDMISSSDPYGALGVPPLAAALHIAHASPTYYFVPDDNALGQYRPVFANSICMLEELEPSKNGENAISTESMFNKLLSDNDHAVDQKSFLKARLLDMLIADFDRHYDQWKWGHIDTGKGRIYYPIPRDRDQAYFNSDGILMAIASHTKLPYMRGFKYKMKGIKKMNFVARDMDRLYLNDLDEHEWQKSLAEFKAELTDDVINTSASSFPREISALDSAMFAGKMKVRRDILADKAMVYYRFLSRKVVVRGSNNNEYFHVSKNDSGLNVTVYARTEDGSIDFPMYSRQFDKHVTKEIAMYGFNGNDVFKIDGNVPKGIKLVMIGGKGSDTFDIHGKAANYIYDLRTGGNVIRSRSHTRNMMTQLPTVNDFNERYRYDVRSFPQPRVNYNPEDRVLVGFGFYSRTYNFRRDPFSTEQSFRALIAPQNDAYQLRYNGVFNHTIHRYDLVVNGQFINPTLNNFFGFGNGTVKDPNKDISFYRVRYKDFDGDVMLRKRLFFDKLKIDLGPTFYYYWIRHGDNAGRILDHPGVDGMDSASVYSNKLYAGGKLRININNVNSKIFPTRGVDWTNELVSMQGMNGNSSNITRLSSEMTVYSSLSWVKGVVGVGRIGAGHIFNENFEYFQALTLGANNFLRGFRKNRFSGQSLAYGSYELRVKVFDFNAYVLAGDVGLIGFGDLGRVWMPHEVSGLWHGAYGGGVYYLPFNMIMMSATLAASKEETLFNFTIGMKINETF